MPRLMAALAVAALCIAAASGIEFDRPLNQDCLKTPLVQAVNVKLFPRDAILVGDETLEFAQYTEVMGRHVTCQRPGWPCMRCDRHVQ